MNTVCQSKTRGLVETSDSDPALDPIPVVGENTASRANPVDASEVNEAIVTDELGSPNGPVQGSEPYTGSPNRESADDETGFNSLDPSSIVADRIASFIFSAVVIVAGMIGLGVLFAANGLGLLLYCCAGAVGLIALILLWASWAWPSIEYRHKSWRLNDVGLEIRNGVWWKHQLAIPWARVQHADVSQGPLQRMFGLGSLTVHTAGTTDSSVTIEGLSHQTALGLRDEVIRQRKSSDVV